MSTPRLHQLAARLRWLEDDFARRIGDREKVVQRAARHGAEFLPDVVRKRLTWLLEKQRTERRAVEAELRARLNGSVDGRKVTPGRRALFG
jgi:hypothetical protein